MASDPITTPAISQSSGSGINWQALSIPFVGSELATSGVSGPSMSSIAQVLSSQRGSGSSGSSSSVPSGSQGSSSGAQPFSNIFSMLGDLNADKTTSNPPTGGNDSSGTGSNGSTSGSSPYGNVDPQVQRMLDSISALGLSTKTMIDKAYADSQTLSSSENSSADTLMANAKTAYDKQVAAVQAGADANFNPDNDPTILAEQRQRDSAVNLGRGGIDQSAAYRVMDKTISDNIKDLEQRKAAAIADGDSKAYDSYSKAINDAVIQRQNALRDQINAQRDFISGYKDVAQMMQSVVMDAHTMSKDELDYKIQQGQLAVSQANSISDAMLRSAEASYYQYQASGKLTDGSVPPGWANSKIGATAYSAEATNAATRMGTVASNIDKNGGDSQAQAQGYSELYNYADQRATALAGIVDRDTLMAMYGFAPGATATAGSAKFGNYTLTPVGALQSAPSFWDWLTGPSTQDAVYRGGATAMGSDKNDLPLGTFTLNSDGTLNTFNGSPVIPVDGKKKT